jgi:hypothetical protein
MEARCGSTPGELARSNAEQESIESLGLPTPAPDAREILALKGGDKVGS